MDKFSRQQFESDFMDIFGNHPGVIATGNITDLNIEMKDLEALWQASRGTPVTLPPMLNLEGRTGRSFAIAGAHNGAITLCAMAIIGAGYTTECSPVIENDGADSEKNYRSEQHPTVRQHQN